MLWWGALPFQQRGPGGNGVAFFLPLLFHFDFYGQGFLSSRHDKKIW
jgi:hypothetical protein